MDSGSKVDLGALFWRLLENYYTFGWPFLILHIGVLLLSIWAWWGLVKEIRHLKKWNPGSQSGGSQATQILDQFIAESRELGKQGFLVPITDFSDRLDSIVGGKVTELYERLNLFLIVGIAGTLFGVFSFASEAARHLNNQNLASDERIFLLGESLSTSLANAFPVGFVGLGLMFIGQVGVSIWENQLKQTVAGATSNALALRVADVRSQALIVENAAKRIETALQPLEHLQETMAKHLAPVVQELGERLDESLGLVKAQFKELQGTTDRFAAAGNTLGGRVETLGTNIGKLDGLLCKVPDILDNFASTQETQQKVIETFQANLEISLQASSRAIEALDNAAGVAELLPEQILEATRETLRGVSLKVADASDAMVDELKKQLTADYDHLFQRVEEMISLLRQSVSTTSDELARNLKESAADLFAGTQKQAGALEHLLERSEEHLRASLEASQGTISALVSMNRSAEDLPSQILSTSQAALQEVVQAAVNTSNTMAGDLKTQIHVSSELLFRQAESQVRALREHLAETTDELLSQLSSEFGELFAGIRGQVKAVHKLIDHTTGQLQAISKAASKAVKGMQGLREEAKGSLVSSFDQIREDADKRWSVMSDRFTGEAQREFATFLEAIRTGTAEVNSSLKGSAQTWFDAAFNANTVIKEPIAEVLEKFSDALQKGVRNLDNLLAQRYPEVVKDVSAFTQELQKLLTTAEAVQQGLDRWVVSVERSQVEMVCAREKFLENLSTSMPQMGGSPEIAALVEERVGSQLMPVRSKLSQMDRTLEELRQRRNPLSWLSARGQRKSGPRPTPPSGLGMQPGPAENPEPTEEPRTFWDRLPSWFPRWRR